MRDLTPAAAALCLVCCALAWCQGGHAQDWLLSTDADGDGVADGWASNSDAGEAEFSLAPFPPGTKVQSVVGKAANDGIYRRIEGLDPAETYLLTALVNVEKGGITWGPEGVKSKYLHGYGRWVESRQTFTGHDSVSVVFYTLVPEAKFQVERLKLRPVNMLASELPVEEEIGLPLVPRPQSVERDGTGSFTIEASTGLCCLGLQREDVNPSLFCRDLGFGDDALPEASAEQAGIVLTTRIDDLNARVPRLELATMGPLGPEESSGYVLRVAKGGVAICAGTPEAAFYGLMTLRQLCTPAGDGKWKVPTVVIRDYPAMQLRGTYQGGATAAPDRLERARYYARLKLNAVVMEDSIFYHLDEGDNLAKVTEYFAYLRSLHLEPIPLVQSFGWGFMVLSVDPECVEAQYIADKPMVFTPREGLPEAVRGQAPEGRGELLTNPEALVDIEAPLTNPGLEAGNDGRPEGWTADAWAEEEGAVLDDEVKTEGAASLRLNRNAFGSMRVWQDFSLPTNARAVFTCDIKAQDISATTYMEVYRLTPQGELIGGPAVMGPRVEGTSDWQTVSMPLNTDDYSHFRIYLRIQEGTGTAWFDNLRVAAGYEPLRNLVHVPDSLQLKSAAGEIYRPGKDYEVIAGETRFPFTTEVKPWWIARLPEGRIPAGGQVLASYEYAPEGAMTYCPSNPRTQAIMKKALQDTATKLGVKRIHIGHDEPRWMNTCKLCKDRGLSNAELLSEELTRMNDFVKSANSEARVMMWADALNPFHNAPHQNLEPANETVPKDIIQCTWFYDAHDDLVEGRSLAYFAEKGYETTGSPWFNLENNWDWAQECEIADRCLGMIYTSWGDAGTDPWAGLSVTAAFSWNPSSPEALEEITWDPAELNRCWGVLQNGGE